MLSHAPQFDVIGGEAIRDVISRSRTNIVELVRDCYLGHNRGETLNPDSYFLKFPDKPEARIIALPAAFRDGAAGEAVSGIKWIASYPRNIDANLQRASAVVLLNDYESGYPFACLEGSQISSARTAASAVLAARHLYRGGKRTPSLSIIGGGVIAAEILDFFRAEYWTFDEIRVHDVSQEHLQAFVRNMSTESERLRAATREEALTADIVVFATTAASPWVPPTHRFEPYQLVLNISLRDIAPESLVCCNNVFDDVDHCMKANTSPHLAQQAHGNRDFVNGTLAQVIEGEVQLNKKKATIFSPFGLGVLDIKLAMFIYRQSHGTANSLAVKGFFPEMRRWV